MKPIAEPTQIKRYGDLVREMMLTQQGEEYHFDPVWVESKAWKVVPVESAMRLSEEEVARIVPALRADGWGECFVVYNEAGYIQDLPAVVASRPPSDMATCYELSIDEADFRELNRQLGPFRFVITAEDRSWAISCNESYNLFGAEPSLLEALLGKPIDQARQDYLHFALQLAKSPDEPLLLAAKHYAAL